MDDDTDDNDTERAAAARKGSPFLNAAQTAHYLKISLRTLEKLSEKGEGPSFRSHGRQKRFHITDIDAWSEQQKCKTTRPRKPDAKP
jgi:excisionase family DNA binding protein